MLRQLSWHARRSAEAQSPQWSPGHRRHRVSWSVSHGFSKIGCHGIRNVSECIRYCQIMSGPQGPHLALLLGHYSRAQRRLGKVSSFLDFKWLQMISNDFKWPQISWNDLNVCKCSYSDGWETLGNGHLLPKGRAEACDEFLASAIDVYQYLQQELMAADQIGHLEDVFSKATWKQCRWW